MKPLNKVSSLLILLLALAVPAQSSEIHLSAAGSLVDAIKSVAATYQQSHPQVKLLINFASSGALAKQIIAGAPTDIYISANPKWMKHLQQQGMIADETQRILLHNSLVLVGLETTQLTSLADVLSLQRIALGSPKSVPAGKYAEQALTAADLYQQLQTTHKLILTKDVRQALLYAERGEVDAAFVYRTDAMLAQQAKILLAVPQRLYPLISYPAAQLKGTEEEPEVTDFFSFLFSSAAQQIFQKYGFTLAE